MAPSSSSCIRSSAAFLALTGELFQYGTTGGRVAFESPAVVHHPLSSATTTTATATATATTLPVRNSNSNNNNNKCILLGGLSDGLLPVPYAVDLAHALQQQATTTTHNQQQQQQQQCWSLVQPILSSSYTGFGHGSLDQDVAELDELLSHLVTYRMNKNDSDDKHGDDNNSKDARFALIGHSTGCQDILHYLKHGKWKDKIVFCALQAPVSDRESATICHHCHASAAEHAQQLQQHLDLAESMRANGRANEMMPRAAFWAPLTARRFLDLFEVNGADDYLSADFTDEQLRERLGHVGTLGRKGGARAGALRHCLVACSGRDEYVPHTVDIEAHLHRMCRAMNHSYDADSDDTKNQHSGSGSSGEQQQGVVAIPLYLPAGNHNLSSSQGADAATFVAKVVELLEDCISSS